MTKAKRKSASKLKGKRKLPFPDEIEVSVEPNETITLTIEASETPVHIRVEGGKVRRLARQVEVSREAVAKGWRIPAWAASFKRVDFASWLFVGALVLYLVTRLVGLTRFPIYFFSDEAIQTQAMAELISNDYRDINRVFLPAYFQNGVYANLSLSVYLQWLPLVLFGKSAFITRAVSALTTLIAAISVGVILRDIFHSKYWWAGTLLLSITPAWFLHSRTAFETAEFTAFFAGGLYFYLLYRYKSPKYLYLTFLFAACAFYSYNPGQLIVPVTAAALLVSDWRYHWERRTMAWKGFVLLAVLAIPYIRYRMEYPAATYFHLYMLDSYLIDDLSLPEKIQRYLAEYATGLSAWFWYTPNTRDLSRHLMKGYGHIPIGALPFAVIGLARTLARARESSYRALLISALVAPISAALVQTTITRVLVFVVPAAILTALGLERVLQWVGNPLQTVGALRGQTKLDAKRLGLALLVFAAGAASFIYIESYVDRVVWAALSILLALHISGLTPWLLSRGGIERALEKWMGWVVPQTALAAIVFLVLAYFNIFMLYDSLKNGPLWYREYGLGGMQYGAFQIFDSMEEYKLGHPETNLILSPTWANGTDVVARFFIDNSIPYEMGNIERFLNQKLPLDDNTLFIMTPDEYNMAAVNEKLTDIRVERIVPYPDGAPGFYFARLRYSDKADELFAAEKAFRAALREATVNIDGEAVEIKYSYLEAGEDEAEQPKAIEAVFDRDELSLAKTFEANPFIVELTFPSPRAISGFSIITGSAHMRITVKSYTTPDAEPLIFTFEGKGSINEPMLSFDFPEPVNAQFLHMEMLDPYSPPPTQIHIWELEFKFNE